MLACGRILIRLRNGCKVCRDGIRGSPPCKPRGRTAAHARRDVGRALSAARRLEFGTVWVNEHLFPLASEMPHGGFKESGYGKDMSLYSMEEYTRIKHVAVKLA